MADMEDVDLFFELYPLNFKKGVLEYIHKARIPFANDIAPEIHRKMKKIDDLLIAVFMSLLPIEFVHGYCERFNFIMNDPRQIQKIYHNVPLAREEKLRQIGQKMENALQNRPNSHITTIWNIYYDVGQKLAKLMGLVHPQQNVQLDESKNNNNDDIYPQIEQILNQQNDNLYGVDLNHLINCFEKMLITFGDCDDSQICIKPMQMLIKAYVDAILLNQSQEQIQDNIHNIYTNILTDNQICTEVKL